MSVSNNTNKQTENIYQSDTDEDDDKDSFIIHATEAPIQNTFNSKVNKRSMDLKTALPKNEPKNGEESKADEIVNASEKALSSEILTALAAAQKEAEKRLSDQLKDKKNRRKESKKAKSKESKDKIFFS